MLGRILVLSNLLMTLLLHALPTQTILVSV